MAQAVAQACSRKERPQTLGGTVEAIDEDPLDLVGRLLLRVVISMLCCTHDSVLLLTRNRNYDMGGQP
jgi:hypothetical protein